MENKRTKILVSLAALSIGVIGLVIFLQPITIETDTQEIASQEENLLAQSAPPVLSNPKSSPQIRAAGAYLMTNGEPLYALGDKKVWPIASITKLMTAFVARQVIEPTEEIVIGKEAVAAFGDVGEFGVGEKFKADDLVKAMLISSSNDAAKALAMHYGEAEFVSEMNKVTREIGMSNTNFVDSAGLSPRNLSTANDIGILVRAIWASDPEIFAITRLPTTTIVDIDKGRSRKLYNTNIFAGRRDFLGGKTGQIPDSEGNLVSIFQVPLKSSPVIIVILGAEDRFKETEKILKEL